jgi:hypothetical protein
LQIIEECFEAREGRAPQHEGHLRSLTLRCEHFASLEVPSLREFKQLTILIT